ncbi:type III pantothenate kinase [Alphaproteobacteria bacterium]|nr:type III pantothenate kinase [Alphaproteobacteria bacterium]MDA9190311.1 type III pantothenate kinase [Alphaproteobacteria bacterium]
MLLAIDCGNTHIVFGIFNRSDLSVSWRFETLKTKDVSGFLSDFLTKLETVNVDLNQISSVILASVVSETAECFENLIRFLNVPFLNLDDPLIKLPIDIELPDPTQVGADRIVNAVAASSLTKSDIIILDFGTATTFDVVKNIDNRAVYKGGVIAPGVNLSVEALSKAASKLPDINFSNFPSDTPVIGTNTQSAMWSGIIWGYVGLIEGIIHKIQDESDTSFKILSTGGLASLYLPYCDLIKWQVPELTLLGLQQIAKINEYQ